MPAYLVVEVDVLEPGLYEKRWGSPEYAEAKALRQVTSRTQMILAEGLG